MLFSACGDVLSLNTLYKHYKKRWGCTVKKKKKKIVKVLKFIKRSQ